MAEEDVVAPPPPDHKRKLEDLEPEAPQPPISPALGEPDDAQEESALGVGVEEPSASPDLKRPRVDDDASVATGNGYEDANADESSNGNKEQENVENGGAEDAELHPKDSEIAAADDVKPAAESNDGGGSEPSALKSPQVADEEEPPKEEGEPDSCDASQQGDASQQQQQQEPFAGSGIITRKIEVPNDKVGVLIGKGGDTVRFLQYNSGAKIQIVRDADADLACSMRPVELIGSLESISKAENLIKDVISEADAGGSPALIARGFSTGQSTGPAEQYEMKVPNEKVGLIIGRGGDTIKGLQTRSGARIQLIPQQSGGGDEPKERTVRVTGHKRQIDIAIEMITDVMKQLPKSGNHSGGYRQQSYQSRGPPAQWGPSRGSPYSSQPMMGYDYQQQRGGPYPSQNHQYPPPAYNSPAPPQVAPRQGGFGFGWDQRPPHHGGSNYDFYGGHGPNSQAPGPHGPIHGHGAGPPPPPANYNYGPSTQGPPPEYGHPGSYSSQTVPNHQGYGYSAYEANKYEGAPPPHTYGSSQPAYSQAAPQSGYYTQQQYGKPQATASYGMSTHPPPQSYGNPRGNQPAGGDPMTTYHQGSTNQFYGSQQQQVYPSSYPAASEPPPMQQQQSYPVYPTDGQGQGGAAAYGSYPSSAQQAAAYPTTDQQATYHQAAPAAAPPQDPSAAAATYPQQQAAGFGQQQPPAANTSYPQYDSTTQQVYGGPPAPAR